MLWQHVLQVPRAWLIAHDTDIPAAQQLQAYRALEARRLDGEPMAYILGAREFMGHEFSVTPDVLIPRPETELLVEVALDYLDGLAARPGTPRRVLDLGTGSGAIAVSIALARPDVQVVATDNSERALAVARRNAEALGARVEFFGGSWYDALVDGDGGRFDLIVSNPPYIAAGDTHLAQGDVRFEPMQALTDGAGHCAGRRQLARAGWRPVHGARLGSGCGSKRHTAASGFCPDCQYGGPGRNRAGDRRSL
jgi:release factor glutamine methyltransferase